MKNDNKYVTKYYIYLINKKKLVCKIHEIKHFLPFWSVNYTIFHTITQKFIFCVLLFITNNIYVHKEKNYRQNIIFHNYHRSRNTLPPENDFYFWENFFAKIILNKS